MRKKGVIPAEPGIQVFEIVIASSSLDAACAGMTNYDTAPLEGEDRGGGRI